MKNTPLERGNLTQFRHFLSTIFCSREKWLNCLPKVPDSFIEPGFDCIDFFSDILHEKD